MSKAIQGAAMLGGAVAMGAAAFFDPALIASPLFDKAMAALVMGGISMEAGALAGALTSNRGTTITTRQAAAFRQVIYGEQRVGGVSVYQSTTGSHHDQYNYVIVVAGHEVDSFVNLYLDGRQVFWAGGTGNVTRNGVNWGGASNGSTYTGPGGQQYNFGGLVYAEACFGDQTNQPNTTPGGGFNTGLQANDGAWTPTSAGLPYVGGCAYFYLKVEYDESMFPTAPEVKVTVRGKNNIFDPRTGTKGYSNNWALVVADVLTDTQFGLGDIGSVNQAQLIAAANVCDEQVALGIGGTEARYCCHYHSDTATAPGDLLAQMMPAAGGRMSRIGGEWYLWPAYWQGPSFTWDANALADGFQWKPYRPFSKLFNRVQGTYIAANVPWNIAGNLYDSNGFYNGSIENNFPFAFQSTSFPAYACDVLHGYSADQYLQEDSNLLGAWDATLVYGIGDVVSSGGVMWKSLADANLNNAPSSTSAEWVVFSELLVKELGLSCVLSVTQAQRLAKIELMRNRYQGTGSFTMMLAAYEMQPTDVMHFTMPALGWTEKVFEVNQLGLAVTESEGGPPSLTVPVSVNETGPDVYEWSTTEELSVYDVPTSPQQASSTPVAPTGLTLTSGAALAIRGADNIVRPRIQASWTEPLDGFVQQIEAQYQLVGASAWTPWGFVQAQSTSLFIDGVVAGQQYNVRIRSVRANGATSAWEEIDGYTVSITFSVITQLALAPGALTGIAYSGGTAGIKVDAFTALVGNLTVACLTAGPFTIPGLNQRQLYFVYYVDPTFAGGAITPIATQNQADYLNRVGYFFIGSVTTPGTGTMTYQPSSFLDLGTSSTTNPQAAYSNNPAYAAQVSGYCDGTNSFRGHCRWLAFPDATPTGETLYIAYVAQDMAGGSPAASITVSFDGGASWTTELSLTADASGTLTVSIPSGTDLNQIQIDAQADPDTTVVSSSEIDIYNIYVG